MRRILHAAGLAVAAAALVIGPATAATAADHGLGGPYRSQWDCDIGRHYAQAHGTHVADHCFMEDDGQWWYTWWT